ncbi:hypothetical protein TRFO_18632 [Tritrichomonas foetus]|uniref:Uncharacterized protein n=1 Tax=Tritrichomonas foetus TaxID=1144522 RepID=A0A1J4KKJ8_9EUKA|nr:hypothetical protein TRFO_18632 [Tritrichomonas foetus]|eukprot:OHT11833.1 hypothetical protein TRFO_18632 [Tritrichomonas foetus]
MNYNLNKILGQYHYAKRDYPNLNQVNSYEYTIVFSNPAHVFQIFLNPDYPQSPPQVKLNGQQIQIPLTNPWSPTIQIKHLLEHLDVFQNLLTGKQFSFSQSEFDVFNEGSDSSEPEKNIDDLATIQDAKNQLALLRKKIPTANEETQKYFHQITSNVNQLNDYYHKIIFLQGKVYGPEKNFDAMRKAKDKKIAQIRQEIPQLNSETEDIQKKFDQGELQNDAYLKQLMSSLKKQYYAETLADSLEMMDF